MRRHAKASTAGSTQRQAAGLGRTFFGAFAIRATHRRIDGSGATSAARRGSGQSTRPASMLSCLLALSAAVLLSAAPASAGTVTNERPLLFSFNVSGATTELFTGLTAVAVDDSSGAVYVVNQGTRTVEKFNAAGEPADFAATGEPSLKGTPAGPFGTEGQFGTSLFTDVAVDNSAANPGRIYVNEEGGPVHAFDAQGNYLWTLPRELGGNPLSKESCGIAVDDEGHLWVGANARHSVLEFANTGSPPALIGSFPVTVGNQQPCRLGIDQAGNAYVAPRYNLGSGDRGLYKFHAGGLEKTLTTTPVRAVAVDQSSPTGHVFAAFEPNFGEYDATGTLINSFGTNLIADARGIAYNPVKDWVYVSDLATHTVKVFGPLASGTVPDVTTEAATEIGVSKVTANGTINPQSVPNSYHVEWKEGIGASWGASESQPLPHPSIEPTDSATHAVSVNVTGLKGNTTYQLRLVGTNTENGLNSYSAPTTFTTLKPTAPVVSIDVPTSITTTSANVTGTVNPQTDAKTTWRLQLSTDPSCASGFSNKPIHDLGSEASVPVAVAEELTGLLPAQTYCVRLSATNGGGTTTADKVFTTAPIPPSEASPAFVAPRSDTTARLNAFVNPQGEDTLAYRFEISADGVNWSLLPEDESTPRLREKAVVGSEVAGLTPNTTYHYRLGSLENGAGPAPSLGAEKTFTTRTTAEATLPQRGIELINNPDKGNQNALGFGPISHTSPISPDGNRVLWTVPAGAPGSNGGTLSAFLAERTPEGWRSKSLTPTVDKQVGGGELGYRLDMATEDLSHFISSVTKYDVLNSPPQTVVRLDRDANQEILATFPVRTSSGALGLAGDLTTDGAQLVAINPETGQLEEMGSGTPELVSVMPDGTPASCGLTAFTSADGDAPAAVTSWKPGYHRIAQTDASRVYFQVSPNGNCAGPEGLYVRNRDTEETTLIDPGSGGRSPQVIRSTPDGRHAYFSSPTQLDPADTNSGRDVYRWDEEAGTSTCMTCEVAANANIGGVGGGAILVSDDFSHVYFPSPEQLVPGEGQKGAYNVYSLSGGVLHFIVSGGNERGILSEPDFSLLSADGHFLTFRTIASRSLTADEVASQCPTPDSEGEPGPCRELYRYDDRDNSIECLSCVRGGLTTHSLGTPSEGAFPVDFQMSADGSTVAFATKERLLRLDVNNDTDIYEWRNGSLRLITDGVSDFQELFAAPEVTAIDPSGANIIFSVVEPGLTGFEHDGLANLYDARIGGGFEPPAPPVHCVEDSCQGPLRAPPGQPQPGSSSFSGRGNGAEGQKRPRCSKSKVRRHGHCVRRHAHKRHHKRASQTNQGRTK